jgi:peroxiredoxin
MSDETPQSKSPRRFERLRKYGKELAIFLVIFFGVMWFQTRGLVASGEPAPAFDLMAIDGGRVSSQSLVGKPTILYFWAPWCGVCKANAHNANDVQSRWGESAQVVSVALSYKNRAEVEAFAKEHAMPEPVLFGEDTTGEDYKINAFPTVYILDAEGKVSGSVVGYTTEFGLHWRLLLAKLF